MLADNKLITIQNPFEPSTRKITPVPYLPGRTVDELVGASGFSPDNIVVVKNGRIIDNLSIELLPGDMVHVCPMINDDGAARSLSLIALAAVAFYVVGPAAAGMVPASYGAGTAAFIGNVAAFATVTVGSMLINSAMAPPNPVYGQQSESPTYGWSSGRNTAKEGIAIPVIYGNEATWPQIINQWIEIDGEDQWSHTLLSVAEGQTNNVPTSADINIDGQPITILPSESYTIETTDGSGFPGMALTNHESLHQMRSINKELSPAALSQILLHFDGNNGSDLIIDSGVGVADDPDVEGDTERINIWTAQNGATITTGHADQTFSGTAVLNLETANKYISCNQAFAFDIWTKDNWDFEVRFRQDVLTDSAIIGQQQVIAGVDQYQWGIFYNAGKICFQQYRQNYVGGAYTVYFDVKETAVLSVDTWHHIRVARSTTTDSDGGFVSAIIHIFLDGTLLGTGSNTGTPAEPSSLDTLGEQFVGRANYYTGTTDGVGYGNCELDELRLYAYGHNYDLTGFTPPSNPISDSGEQTFFTKGSIDSFSIITRCPYGLYKANPDGTITNAQVGLWVSYRKVGASEWVRKFVDMWDASRSPVSEQFSFIPSAGRGQYEIRVSRLRWWNAEAFGYADLFQTDCFLISIDEVLDETLWYPYLQLLSVSILAQEKISGHIPTFQVVSNRTEIDILNYAGVGPNRTVDATNNAMCAFDMITNRVYGAGVDASKPIKDLWESWEDWCDGLVGGNKRCQVNMVFDQTMDLDEALQNIESAGRARIIPRGTKIAVVLDKPTDAGHLFCPENIVPGTDRTVNLRTAERSDAVEITFRDANKDFTDSTVFVPSSNFYSLSRVPRVTKLNMLAINNEDQARRQAILLQQISENTKTAVSLQTGLEGIPVISGDVFDYAHGGSATAFTGRISKGSSREQHYAGTTVYIDKEITLDSTIFSGNCMIVIRNQDDTMNQYTVSGPFDSATRSVTLSASGVFEFLSPFIITNATGQIYQYKVDSIQRSSNKDVLVTGKQYVESSYYNSNYDGGTVPI